MSNDKYILIGQTPVPEPDFMKWAVWFEEANESRIVAQTSFDGGRVSTVFLGMDHRWFGDGPPLIFETMIFCDDEDSEIDGYQRRCSTWAEAEAQHDRACAKVGAKRAVNNADPA